MDTTIATVLILVLFALIVVAAFVRYRRRNKTDINGPFGMRLSVEASDDPPPQEVGVRAKRIVSEDAGVVIEESIQRGIDAEDIHAKKDVRLSSSAQNPSPSLPSAPRVEPPQPTAPHDTSKTAERTNEDSTPK